MTQTVLVTKADKRAERKKNKAKANRQKYRRPLVPKTNMQAAYIEALEDGDQVFAVGGAGTGKTYIASRHALRQLLDGECDKVIVTRPTVTKKKHELGFLPGSLDDKLGPWLIPLVDAMKDETSSNEVKRLMREGKIEFLSFEHMRGRSLPDCVVILDEAQNCDLADLRMFLTRIGENTQVIVCGDTDQVDIPDSGLDAVVDMILKNRKTSATLIEFSDEDVVRSETAREWVEAFSLHYG